MSRAQGGIRGRRRSTAATSVSFEEPCGYCFAVRNATISHALYVCNCNPEAHLFHRGCIQRWLETSGATPEDGVCPVSGKAGTLRDFDAERDAFVARVCHLKAREADQVLSDMFASCLDLETCLIFPWAERQVGPTLRHAASLGGLLRRDLRWAASLPKLQRFVLSAVRSRRLLDRAALVAALDFCHATLDHSDVWTVLVLAVAGCAFSAELEPKVCDAALDLICKASKDGIIGSDVATEYESAVGPILGRLDDSASAARRVALVAVAPKCVLESATLDFSGRVVDFLRWASEKHPELNSAGAARWAARCFAGEARAAALALVFEIETREIVSV